jgi:hypothetical protein
MIVRVKENSWLAGIAARKLKAKKVAMVIGTTIHLFNTTRAEFLSNERWLNHELTHVKQYAQYGFYRFLFLYLYESVRSGYWNNKFEVEARSKENDQSVIPGFIIT